MEREARQKYIKTQMAQGLPFEKVYKESDGIPRFSFWIHTSVGTSYMVNGKTQQEVDELCKQIIAKSKRVDLLGYEIED